MVIPIIVFDYELRKDYIIKVYCINKNLPELHCDGKCYLAKKIAQSKEKDENQAMNAFLSHLFTSESINQNEDFCFLSVTEAFFIKDSINFFYKLYFPNPPIFSLFNPPKSELLGLLNLRR